MVRLTLHKIYSSNRYHFRSAFETEARVLLFKRLDIFYCDLNSLEKENNVITDKLWLGLRYNIVKYLRPEKTRQKREFNGV